mgnify:CR=1 FL=1
MSVIINTTKTAPGIQMRLMVFKISPNQKVKQLSKKRIEKLIQIIRIVLLEAIDAGGSSLKDHRQTSGEIGYFQHNFAVYGRMNESCLNHDCNSVIKTVSYTHLTLPTKA